MKKILINFAHPAKRHSSINKTLIKAVKNLENITINDLYANYPDFLIDVKREQKLCEEHDIIIFQHPLYWYSTPAIVKEWQDLVLEHGWAYGSNAEALKDKIFLEAISAGRDEETYHKDGLNEFTLEEFISPRKITAKICKMTYLPPFCIFGSHRGIDKSKLETYTAEYRKALTALRDEILDLDLAKTKIYLNEDLDSLIKKAV
ncbi:flavodoxin-like fold domain-containing protein, putative NAD(P)H (quinone) dehydrogenase/reductase [Campylobacter blaseri]|uniref:NAD(P)H oxidoreductase n=1 Tax=Campylobacter blaseri TaxID=2042961 RepID=A0A2P8R3M9_9BACT|nr:NAD(P)H-dependent oxidoreductase [Campylobacter blaseri]PSM53110.1 NAD(P)H oxidoreductase [Campylobacter blaseri]PSM54576.1 NAD(P)H oxidoreductase [Campylobacter blaseri]QKF86951.1 flavodoxin-like fold domain-containing protein, putative NAD(P)H (quinone) dehydrogenase/reductase [Campylobacter blaseri]